MQEIKNLTWLFPKVKWGDSKLHGFAKNCTSALDHYAYFFHKRLGSGLSTKRCLYFQGVPVSKLLNGCLVVWPFNLGLRGID